MMRRHFLRGATASLLLPRKKLRAATSLSVVPPNAGFITDTAIHAPPTTGPYAYSPPYGNWIPGQGGFLALAGSYIDPIFGTAITRETNVNASGNLCGAGDIYGKNGWFNADATYFATSIVDTSFNSVVRAVKLSDGSLKNLPNRGGASRAAASFHPTNADMFLDFNGNTIEQTLLSTLVTSTFHDFGTPVGDLGGSFDWITSDGNYMLVNLATNLTAPQLRIYDVQNNVLFSGTVTDTSAGGTGWAAITPNGSHIVVIGSTKKAFAINKGTQTLSTSGVTLTGFNTSDHSCPISCSDGNSYLVSVNNDVNPAILLRCDLNSGSPTTFLTLPTTGNAYWTSQPGHFSAVSKGVYQDWMFCSSELSGGPSLASDNFNGPDPVASWDKMQNEIYAVNVLTGALRRLGHTRNRQAQTDYQYQPRVCVSWDGTKVAWSSNYGFASSPVGGNDLYVMAVPQA